MIKIFLLCLSRCKSMRLLARSYGGTDKTNSAYYGMNVVDVSLYGDVDPRNETAWVFE
jgi:hypothetical protein